MGKNEVSHNQSLRKALRILTIFTRDNQELRLKEISKTLDIPQSTVYRLLRTLEDEDFIKQNPDSGKYLLGATAFTIGTNVVHINRLIEVALPYIARLSTKYNATTHVAIEQNNRVLCVEKIEPATNIVKTPPRGSRHDLQLTSVGKCIMAFSAPKKQKALVQSIKYRSVTSTSIMDTEELINTIRLVRQRGYAIDAQESAENLYCFGAPILDTDGYALGAISVSLNSSVFPDSASSIIRDVVKKADEISKEYDKLQFNLG